jgi:hypothetical protein
VNTERIEEVCWIPVHQFFFGSEDRSQATGPGSRFGTVGTFRLCQALQLGVLFPLVRAALSSAHGQPWTQTTGDAHGACAQLPRLRRAHLVCCESGRNDEVALRRKGRTHLRPGGDPEPDAENGHRPSLLTPWRIGGIKPACSRSATRASP